MDLDGGYPYILPIESLMSNHFGGNLFSNFYAPGSMALEEAFNCVSKFAGALLIWFSSGASSNFTREISGNQKGPPSGNYKSSTLVKHIASCKQNIVGFHFSAKSKGESRNHVIFGKISRLTVRHLFNEAEGLQQACSVLSIASVLVPPFDNLSSNVLAIPLETSDIQMHNSMDQRPCEVGHPGSGGLSFPDLNWMKHAVEPKTGIEFPTLLENILDGHNTSNLASEVLVGTGSRTMKVIRIKSLKVYAFGFYVHPSSLCERLGPKYASVPACELNKCHEFYQDLLRADIDMSVRLVVNCNGLKIHSVKDVFEKSLRARLLKANPDTDYDCLRSFASFFTQDSTIPVGTTIDFRRTSDGQLITEIGGKHIGAVQSKDLCRAFFGMYIGDFPVSEQTKEEIGKNVANIMKRC